VVVVTAVCAAFAVVIVIVIMSVIVAMPVIMIVRGVRMFFGQEIGIDVEDGIQVEAADVQQCGQVGFAKVDGRDRGARIDAHQPGPQGLVINVVDQIFLGNEQAIGKAHLFLGFFLLVQRFHAVLGVDHGDDGI